MSTKRDVRRTLRRFLIRLGASVTRRCDEERLKEELEGHVAFQTADNIRAGLPPHEARRQALVKFGGVEAMRERYREEQGLRLLDTVVQDVRYSLRLLRKSPLFAIAATLSLAMGIGANTAVFTVIERVLLRQLAVANPEELVYVTDQRILQEQSPRFSYPFYAALRDNAILNGVAARAARVMNAGIDGQVMRVTAELVSGDYFDVLGAGTRLGRALPPHGDLAGEGSAVAVISDAFWRRSFSSDPSVLGRAVQLNEQTFTIIGVAAEGFAGNDVGRPADIWVPMTVARDIGRELLNDTRTNWLEIIGRLNPGMSRDRASAQLAAYVERAAPFVQTRLQGTPLILVPGDKGHSSVRREIGPTLRVVLALTALALVLACINVASLLAARSAAREKEIAMRLALGAGRARLAQQFVTETMVLAALGGTAGLLTAPWAARLLVASQPYQLAIDTRLDVRVFVFGAAASVLAGLVVGQAPLVASTTVEFTGVFERFSRPTASTRRWSVHDLIVTLQIALSLAMLISAALLAQSLRSLSSIDPGFQTDDLLLVSIDPGAAGYDGIRMRAYWRETLERINQISGVRSASLARIVPMTVGRQRQPVVDETTGESVEIDANVVGPAYFRTLGIPLLSGREFDERDETASRPVVIVNERLAKAFWPGQDAIGKPLRIRNSGDSLAEVVGVVKDVKYRDLRGDTGPMFYRPFLQTTSSDAMTLHVRAPGDAGFLAAVIRREVQAVDATVPLFAITTLEDQMNSSFAATRQAAVLSSAFGTLALLLSGIGVYGITALAVRRRTRDIGIRMALGAQPRHIIDAIGRRGLALLAAGLTVGLAASFGFTRAAAALLYGVTTGDGATFAGMSMLLALVCLVAIGLPLRAAMRLDAVAAIRCE